MFGWMILCFGTEFFGDVGIVENEGNYYRNMRNIYMDDYVIIRMNWSF